MKTLITGGCGFIGTNFIEYILTTTHKDKIKIVNVDKLSYYSNPFYTKNIPSYYTFKKCDITDTKRIKEIFADFKPDVVINFAAESHVDRSFYNASEFIKTNVVGSEILFTLSKKFGVKKFIHISTDEVFGEKSDKDKITENFREYNPSNPYAASKASAELVIFALSKSLNFPIVLVRTNNNYGPYQFPEKLIPLSILLLLSNKKVPIYGDGKQKRKWLYVADFCSGLIKILNNKTNQGIFHIATSEQTQNIDIVKQICKLLKKEKMIEFIPDRPAHDRCYSLDFQWTSKTLNWKPKVSISSGLKKTVNWYLKNIQWLENIKKNKSYIKFLKMHYNITLS